MRRVIFQMMTTLDGFFEGRNGNLDWHHTDEAFNAYAGSFLRSLDMLLFGRVTYEMMASYWPTEIARTDDPMIAGYMNGIAKTVFSKTLKAATWENTSLVAGEPAEEVQRLIREPGRDMAIFGSSDLAVNLIEHDLIDEYRIFVNPTVLGSGKRLFEGLDQQLSLRLANTRVFKSGLVLLTYEPARAK